MHDEFIGLYSIPQTDAGTITTVSTECVLPVEPTSEHVSQSVLQYNRAAGLDIKLVDAVARGASRFENLLAPLKTYWPPQKLTGPFLGYISLRYQCIIVIIH